MYSQNNLTVGQRCDRWLCENQRRWSARTVGGYRNLIDRHISPGIGKIPLTELTQDTVTGFYDSLRIRGLSARSVWCVHLLLRRIEDRQTFQCYPSYEAIGKAVGVSKNTVAKYVRSLEEKGLIRTEPTVVRSKDGRLLNGNLLYTICPIQAAVEAFYERQLREIRLPPVGWENCIFRESWFPKICRKRWSI